METSKVLTMVAFCWFMWLENRFLYAFTEIVVNLLYGILQLATESYHPLVIPASLGFLVVLTEICSVISKC